MVIAMSEHEAKFQVGKIVHHKLFDYIGVVFDVDPEFHGTDEWYQQVARSRPPKDEPWYHVLVNETAPTTYVAVASEIQLDSRSLSPVIPLWILAHLHLAGVRWR